MEKKRLRIKYIHNVFGNYWIVKNKKAELLGTFSYDEDWKKMVWSQCRDIKMSDCCLDELSLIMKGRLKWIITQGGKITKWKNKIKK